MSNSANLNNDWLYLFFWVIFSLLAHVPACMQVNMSTKKQAYRFEVYSRKVTFFSVHDYLTLFTCIYISIYFISLFCMLFLPDCSLSDPLLHVIGTLALPYEQCMTLLKYYRAKNMLYHVAECSFFERCIL